MTNSTRVAVGNTDFKKDAIQQAWTSLSEADKFVILGHSRPELSSSDKVKLAGVLTKSRDQARKDASRNSNFKRARS